MFLLQQAEIQSTPRLQTTSLSLFPGRVLSTTSLSLFLGTVLITTSLSLFLGRVLIPAFFYIAIPSFFYAAIPPFSYAAKSMTLCTTTLVNSPPNTE